MQTLCLYLSSQQRKINFHTGPNLWPALVDYLQTNFPTHGIFVIADNQVAALFGEIVAGKLVSHPDFRGMLTFPTGEQSKCRVEKDRLEDILLEKKAGRDTVLIAMGGGVTGDMVGYIAATLHRGVPLIHLPTSLLAQVDSSIGGKVGINHSAGKNLIGAFYQPAAVFADTESLKTLSDDEFINGMAEVIKYAATLDDELWDWLESDSEKILAREPAMLEKIVARCAAIKIDVVSADEKEGNYRSVLNFGHTAGHAIELLSRYRIKHGFAIAAGMKIAAALSQKCLAYPQRRVDRLAKLLDTYELNRVDTHEFSLDEIWQCMLTDKKSRQQQPHFSLMNADNKPALFYPITKTELADVFFAS